VRSSLWPGLLPFQGVQEIPTERLRMGAAIKIKSILIWSELHPFERLGLTLDYLLKTEGISELNTETIQGLLRPESDKHANKKLYADPIFAVYGTVT